MNVMDDPFPAALLPDIKRLFQSEETREVGQDYYQDVFDTGCFFPLQRQQEMAAMIRAARKIKPRVIYEIGADKGGGLYHWCKCIDSVERVIACEIRGTPYRALFEQAFPDIDFLWLEESSYHPDTVKRVEDWLAADPIDILFIDGDKSHFLTDFRRHLYLMRDSGIVFMHDIRDGGDGGPKLAYQEAIKGYRHREILDTTDTARAMAASQDYADFKATAHEAWLLHWLGQSCGVGVIYL